MKNNSAANKLTPDGLNRRSELRTDEAFIRKIFTADDTRFIPLQTLKLFFKKEYPYKAFTLSYKDIAVIPGIEAEIIYLGELNGINYFAFDTGFLTGAQPAIFNDGDFKELRPVMPFVDGTEASLLAYSRAIIHWHQHNKFCGVCGSATVSKDAGHRRECTNPECKTVHFPRTDPAIIVLVSNGDACLLGRQKIWPQKRYSTIAGRR